jgi:hypothetical protein
MKKALLLIASLAISACATAPSMPMQRADWGDVAATLGMSGSVQPGHGVAIPPAAGMATAINFQPTGRGRAAISGDLVMLASEVNPVIRELRAGRCRRNRSAPPHAGRGAALLHALLGER